MDKKTRKNRRLSHDYDYNSSDSDSSYKVKSNDALYDEPDRSNSIIKPIAFSSFQNNESLGNKDICERFQHKNKYLPHQIKSKNDVETGLPHHTMLFNIINDSCQQSGRSDGKKRSFSAERESRHKNPKVDEVDSKINRIRFGDPTPSRQIFRFEENISYSSDHENNASNETIISSNGVPCQQPGISDGKKRFFSAERESRQRNRKIDDGKIKRIRFGDPSPSRQIVRFEENISYSSDHENNASNETIIRSNAISSQQPGRTGSKKRSFSAERESQHKNPKVGEVDSKTNRIRFGDPLSSRQIVSKTNRIRFGDPLSSRQIVRFEENISHSSDHENNTSNETMISSNAVSSQQPGRSDPKKRSFSAERESQYTNPKVDEVDNKINRIRFGDPSSSRQIVRFEENVSYSSDHKNNASNETMISSNAVSSQQPGRTDSKKRSFSVEREIQHKNPKVDEVDSKINRIRFGDPSSSRKIVRFEENIPYSSDHKNNASNKTMISSNAVSSQQPGRTDSKNQKRSFSVEREIQHKNPKVDEVDSKINRIRFGDPSSSRQIVRFEENVSYSSDHENNASNETMSSSNAVSSQQPGRTDSKKRSFSVEREIQHKNPKVDEADRKINRIRFGDPSSSRQIVRFEENIPYPSDHENNASNEKIIRNNGVSCEQTGSTGKTKPTSILSTRFRKKETGRHQKKQVKFNLSLVNKNRAEKDDLDYVSSDEEDSTVIKSANHDHFDERPGCSDEFGDSDERYSCLYGYKICDTSKTYFGLKIAKTDIKVLQYKVRLQNPKSFVVYLREQVRAIKISIQRESDSSLIQSLTTKLCTSHFIYGDCHKRRCQFAHELPKEKFYQLEDYQRLALLTSIFNQCKQEPSLWLGRLILDWLRKELKYVYEILLISEYFSSFDGIKYKTIWKVILKSLVACGLEEWQAVSWILIYYYNEDHIEIVQNLIDYLDIEKRLYSYYWRSVRPLTQLGFILTEGIIKQLLTQICSNPKTIGCFSKESISEINLQVEHLSLQSTLNLLPLIENFVGIQKKTSIEADNIPVRYDIIPHLIPAMHVEDIAGITKTLINYSKTREHKEAIAKLIIEFMPAGRASFLIETVIQETYENDGGENARFVMGRVCVTYMLSSFKKKDWETAYDLLLLLKKTGISPIASQPLGLDFSEVNIVLACSKIYFYNAKYHSSIITLSDNNLLNNDRTTWEIKGSSSEFELIIDHVLLLMRTFHSRSIVEEAKLLFTNILNSQKSLSTPIDLLEFYEPLLSCMLYEIDKYKNQIIPFYKEVNLIDSSLMLNPFSYRALVALSYQIKEYRFSKEMVKNAIKCFAYFPYNKEKNVIYLAPYMTKEEMSMYLFNWLCWYNQNEDRSNDVQLRVNFMEPSTNHSEKFLISPILSLPDRSLSAAVNRFIDAIEVFVKTSIVRPKKEINSFTLPKTLFAILLRVVNPC